MGNLCIKRSLHGCFSRCGILSYMNYFGMMHLRCHKALYYLILSIGIGSRKSLRNWWNVSIFWFQVLVCYFPLFLLLWRLLLSSKKIFPHLSQNCLVIGLIIQCHCLIRRRKVLSVGHTHQKHLDNIVRLVGNIRTFAKKRRYEK